MPKFSKFTQEKFNLIFDTFHQTVQPSLKYVQNIASSNPTKSHRLLLVHFRIAQWMAKAYGYANKKRDAYKNAISVNCSFRVQSVDVLFN